MVRIDHLAADDEIVGPVRQGDIDGRADDDPIAHLGRGDLLARGREVDAVGFHAQLGPLENWDLALRDRSVLVDTRMETTQPMVFAAGDIATYDGKVKLIAVGFGEVATAVNNLAARLQPDVGLAPGHSSDAPPPALAPEVPA